MHRPTMRRSAVGAVASLYVGLWAAGSAVAAPPVYDLVITDGRVMDPESGLDAVRNVGISGGKIVSISNESLSGKDVIDAKGLVVSPGFIDLHAHVQSPLTFKLHAQDGVTTSLELESGAYPITRWYQDREAKTPINYGASVSHSLAKSIAMGALPWAYVNQSDGTVEAAEEKFDEAAATALMVPASPVQIAEMDRILKLGLNEGGLGFGFFLVDPIASSVEEMRHFYGLAADAKVGSFIHMRSAETVEPIVAAQEAIDAARSTGAAIHLVHVGSSGLSQTKQVLDLVADAQREGLAITTEVYPYTAASSSMDDPRTTEENMKIFGVDFSDFEFVETGERLTQESFRAYKKSRPTAELAVHLMKEADVTAAVVSPVTAIASDGGDFIDGKGHPRGAGTFARVLGGYVRDRQALPLMEALRKMTLLPAQILETFVPQMKERGRLQPGMVADITIFDPETISDAATFSDPDAPSRGIAFVLVNGQPILKNRQFIDGVFPGVAIRNAVTEPHP